MIHESHSKLPQHVAREPKPAPEPKSYKEAEPKAKKVNGLDALYEVFKAEAGR
jgi:hypothetical protein